MGSYLSKAESPSGTGRPAGSSGSGGNPREQLRERLIRPNHGVPTPNRRLSFGEPVGAAGRFTITPQRHYPLQQLGSSPVGVFPPAQWDSFRKKNILTQRNTPVHSPVTVKIARPDNTIRSPFFDQLNTSGTVPSPGCKARADPCSRETVLNVLRANRKRDVDEDDDERAHEAGQKTKRRRNDSSESSQSVFEPLLANGAPAQLIPKPGSLKRGLNVCVLEESTVKRSRTSSISSVSGCPVSCGVPGSARNPIRSSYSSSQGYPQRRLASTLSSSPLVSPGSSQSQTPERAAKKPREHDETVGNSDSASNTKMATETAPGSGKCTPLPDPPVTSRSDSGGSSGKRKRKIQLVSMCRSDQISLPPPPELGFTITVKDLDMEKKAALTQIQKVLEEPEPEKPSQAPHSSPPAAPSVGIFSQVSSFSSASATPVGSANSLASLTTPAAGLPPAATAVSTPAPAPTIDLTVAPSSTVSVAPIQTAVLPTSATSTTVTATPVANPLLESLKNMKSSSLISVPSLVAATSAAPATSVAVQAPSSVTSTALSFGAVKTEPPTATPQPTVSTAPSSMPSAFAQILAQPLPSSSTILKPAGGNPFGFTSSAPTTCTVSAQPASSTANPTQSTFKPIFAPAMTMAAATAEVKTTPTTFKPIFGSFNEPASSTSSVPATQSSISLFGGVTNTQSASSSLTSSGPTQNPSQSLFGSQSNSHSVAAPVSSSSIQNPTPSVFGGLTTSQTMAVSISSSASNTQNSTQSLFGGLANSQPMTASLLPSSSNNQNPAQSMFRGLASSQPMAASISTSSSSTQNSTSLFGRLGAPKSSFQFGGLSSTPASSGVSTSTTSTSSTNTTLQFGSLKPAPTAPSAAPQNTFAFGQSTDTTSFTGFGMATNTTPMTSSTPATQATFGSPLFSASTGFANPPASSPVKPFAFGASAGRTTVTPLTFGTPASTAAPTFGNSTQSVFGGASTGFGFGNTTALPVSAASVPAPTFTFGAAAATPQNSAASGGFNFTAALSGAQFGTPTPAGQNQGFSFGAGNTDNKSSFGTSTPAFGTQSGPIPFGSPGTPVGGFGAANF
ncbi:nuclear envelope pore membrane protein, partial [Clarias magur]